MTDLYCANCGRRVDPEARTCAGCGAPTAPTGGSSRGADPGATAGALPAAPFDPNRIAALTVSLCLVMMCVIGGAAIAALLGEIDLIDRIKSGQIITAEEAERSDDRQRAIAFIWVGAMVLTAAAYLGWLYVAVKNLDALGVAGRRFSAAWAVGWHLIPIANIWKPFEVLGEVWRASAAGADRDAGWPRQALHPVIGAWWWLWVALGVGGNAGLRLANPSEGDANALRTYDLVFIGLHFALIVIAAMAIVVVGLITERQRGAREFQMARGPSPQRAPQTPAPRSPDQRPLGDSERAGPAAAATDGMPEWDRSPPARPDPQPAERTPLAPVAKPNLGGERDDVWARPASGARRVPPAPPRSRTAPVRPPEHAVWRRPGQPPT